MALLQPMVAFLSAVLSKEKYERERERKRMNIELEGRRHWQHMPKVVDHGVQWIMKGSRRRRVWWGRSRSDWVLVR